VLPYNKAPVGAGNVGSFNDSVSSGGPRPPKFGAPVRIRLGAIQWLILCAAALVLRSRWAPVSSHCNSASAPRGRRARTQQQRLLLSRHFDQQLGDLQPVHDMWFAYLQEGNIDTADQFERTMSLLSVHEMLRTALASLPHVAAQSVQCQGLADQSSEMAGARREISNRGISVSFTSESRRRR